MWGSIVWLLFGGDVSLSQEAMTVTPQCTSITPKKAMTVKGDGAALVIELPFLPRDQWPAEITGRLDRIGRDYPPGRVKATLHRVNGTTVEIANSDERRAGNDDFQLTLRPAAGFSERDEFVSLRVCANPAIQDAHLFWRRVGK
jgi:hypothetical protein